MYLPVIGHGIGEALPRLGGGDGHVQLQIGQQVVVALPTGQLVAPAAFGADGLAHAAQVQLFSVLARAAAQRDGDFLRTARVGIGSFPCVGVGLRGATVDIAAVGRGGHEAVIHERGEGACGGAQLPFQHVGKAGGQLVGLLLQKLAVSVGRQHGRRVHQCRRQGHKQGTDAEHQNHRKALLAPQDIACFSAHDAASFVVVYPALAASVTGWGAFCGSAGVSVGWVSVFSSGVGSSAISSTVWVSSPIFTALASGVPMVLPSALE